ncbi:MAG: 3-oxoacyl-[acyl-carrier-protein] reductase [Deltaproteobacteria bacterium]|nr:3-oxoacyl-[acyl-carrier-protein] reductase [Deltaproteobacteria bacterium]
MEESRKVVVVTGGSRGIGRAVALRFAEDRARIVIVHYDRDDSAADETLRMLSEKGAEAESHRVDVSYFKNVEALFGDIIDRLGTVHVLVNNAGIVRDSLLLRLSEEDWDEVIRVNLKSVFNCTKMVIRPMTKQRWGRIVNTSSVVGQIGNAGQTNYAASKAGIMAFTKSLAYEVASRNVTVNAVAPGFIDTDMTRPLPDKVKEYFLQKVLLGRIGQPLDVAEVVYWLCSDAAGYMTGQILHVNGGIFM